MKGLMRFINNFGDINLSELPISLMNYLDILHNPPILLLII